MDRVARLISGHGRGLVLGGRRCAGSSAFGCAARVPHESGLYDFDAVGGTSIGAIIAAGVANMWDTDDDGARVFATLLCAVKPLSDWTLPLIALTRGKRSATTMLRQSVRLRSTLKIWSDRFFCVSTNLSGEGQGRASTRAVVVVAARVQFDSGRVAAGACITAMYIVDGALVDNLPTDVMADDGIEHITAVSIRADIELRGRIMTNSRRHHGGSLLDAATPQWHRVDPAWLATLTRAAMINSEETGRTLHRERADLY